MNEVSSRYRRPPCRHHGHPPVPRLPQSPGSLAQPFLQKPDEIATVLGLLFFFQAGHVQTGTPRASSLSFPRLSGTYGAEGKRGGGREPPYVISRRRVRAVPCRWQQLLGGGSGKGTTAAISRRLGGTRSLQTNRRHSLTEPFPHLPRTHRRRWEQEQIRRNKKPFLRPSLHAAGKKYHFLRGKSICPGLHTTENDYTAAGDRVSQAKPPAPWDAWAQVLAPRSPGRLCSSAGGCTGIARGWMDPDAGTLRGSCLVSRALPSKLKKIIRASRVTLLRSGRFLSSVATNIATRSARRFMRLVLSWC